MFHNTPPDQRDEPLMERRRHPRIGFDCPIRWNTGGVDRPGWSRDVSEENAGFTVRAISAPVVGERIGLIFELEPTLDWLVHEEATVRRCDQRQPGIYDVGVQFSYAQHTRG